ncbi:glycoside hydrolase family 3 protein [Hyaloscypha variabilis]
MRPIAFSILTSLHLGLRHNQWQAAYDKAYALIQTLSGDGGNFGVLATLDSSTNPLTYFYVTTWPAGLAIAMTWDKDAIQAQGKALGMEFRGKGINLAYAPTIEPLGRSAYSKYFIMNEQETNSDGSGSSGGGGGSPTTGGSTGNSRSITARQSSNSTASDNLTTSSSSDPYDVVIDDKAFHETYLAPFCDAVKSGVAGTMCAMNKVNGTYSDLLGKYLKVELGMPGIVHADVGAQHTGINSANAGMDYGSSSDWSNDTLGVGLTNGSFTSARLDDMAVRNMTGYFHYNQDQGYPTKAGVTDYVDVRANYSTLARAHAANSIALLKNTNNSLSIKEKRSISIFESHAAPRYVGANTALTVYDGFGPTMYGHMSTGSSGGFMLRWWLNDTTVSTFSGMSGAGTELTESTLGGGDRSELYNDEQDTLVNAVADNCNNTIVIINTTVLYGGPLGQESGNAIDDYFDKYDLTPCYAFGYGLSYTTFDYSTEVTITSNSTALSQAYATGDLATGGREDLWDIVSNVTSSVSNTDDIVGVEVAQLYVTFPDAADEPVRQLRGFQKVTIQPSEIQTVNFELKRRYLGIWDVSAQSWKIEEGDYVFYIGASSRDLKAQTTLTF